MKFREYISEAGIILKAKHSSTRGKQLTRDELLSAVKSKCQPILKVMSSSGHYLRRWIGASMNNFELRTTRRDREPADTNIMFHDMMDDYFKEKFGWKARSENVMFAFGAPYSKMGLFSGYRIAFPVGKFRFIWSPEIYDVTVDLGIGNYDIKDDRDFITDLDEAKYTDKNIIKALKSGKEIMIQCKEYYSLMITHDIMDDLKELGVL